MASPQLRLQPRLDRPRRPTPPHPTERKEPGETGPAWLKGGGIPSLDGLRALSISLVLLGHASLTWGGATGSEAGLARLGGIGVDLFFVISGFLITLLLLRERRKTGATSLRAFYVRRSFRILPAYLVFLLSVLILSGLGLVSMTGRDWAGALTYTTNFLPGTSWPVGHLWSLSVEEHFYLLWPLLLVVAGPRRACVLAAGWLVLAPFVRLAIWRGCQGTLDIDYCTPARIDTIAAGCLLAYLVDHTRGRGWLAPPSAGWAAGLAVLCVGGLVVSNGVLSPVSGAYGITMRRTVDALSFAGLVWAGASQSGGALAGLLNATPLVWVGRLSYSLYLWQQPFLNPHSDAWMCRWPVNLFLALGLALASFALVERPLLSLRERRGWGKV
jgi:peptidoglycan/LPS O-acetylase OafA/YrhL